MARRLTIKKTQAETRDRALHALSHMRREKLSMAEACRLEHIKPATFLRQVGTAVRQDRPGGRYHAAMGDSFRRGLQFPTALGMTTVPVHGSKDARELSRYLNAVGSYLRSGSEKRLRQFKGKSLNIGRGKAVEFLTDPDTLTVLAEKGLLKLDQLYSSATGRQ